MTNENLDIQSALRPLNVSVRGGRLTKFKGRVASLAPGLFVVATAAVLFSGSAAHAENECGAPGEVTLTEDIDGVNATVRGATCRADANPSTPAIDPYINGITYNVSDSDGLTLRLDRDHEITVRGQGVKVEGSDGAGDIHVRMGVRLVLWNHGHLGGTITTNGGNRSGLSVRTVGNSDVTSQLDKGTITTNGHTAHGVNARINNDNSAATAMAIMTGGYIYIHGASSSGLNAHTEGTGNVTAHMSGGLIVTDVHGGHGVSAGGRGLLSTSTVKALMTGGVVETKQAASAGIAAQVQERGSNANINDNINMNAHAELVAGKVTTAKRDSVGVEARVIGNDAEAKALMFNGDIDTSGLRSSGLQANADGTGGASLAELRGPGRILTRGEHAHGLQAFANNTADASTATARVVMRAGEVKTRGGSGARGMYVQANGGNGTATAEMHGGSIFTSGSDAHAIYARIDSLANDEEVKVIMTGGSIETTNSLNAFWGSHGIHADTTGSADLNVDMRGGTITMVGRNSHGIFAEAEADARDNGVRFDPNSTPRAKTIVSLGADAVVTASGAGSDGIRVSGNYVTVSSTDLTKFWLGVKEFDVDVAGRVTGGADGLNGDDAGAAIRVISDADGGGAIDIASTAEVTAGASGIAIQDGDGAAVVTSAGTITGDVFLGAGDDKLTLTGGRVTGLIDGGTGDDHLTLSGRTMISMENVTNWERVTLNETNLRLDGTARLEMDLSIDAESVFHASGVGRSTGARIAGRAASASGGGLTIVGDVTNSGTLSVQDGVAGDVITIEGDYTGSGSSVFALDAVVDADGANTDRLVITGDASGETTLSIAGLGGADLEGAPLVMDVVTVDGEANGTFTLVGGNHVMSNGEHAVISGAHLYKLAETDQGLALSARLAGGGMSWGPSAPIYDSYGASLLAFNAPSGLYARGSSQDFRNLAWSGQGAENSGSPLWVQMGTDRITSAAEQSTTGAVLESSLWEMEIGADIVLDNSTAGLLVGGLMLSYGSGSTDVSSDFGDGLIETTGLGLGLAATWYDRRGFYVDGQVTVSSYSSDLSSDDGSLGSLTEGNSGTGYALSLEAGQQLDLGSRLTVIPQAQLSLSSVAFDDFEGERHGERVTLEDAVSQQLRLGLEFGAQDQGASGVYGMVNLYHDFGSGSEVRVGSASLTSENEAWAVGFGIGGSYAWNDRVDLFGEASYATGLSNAGDASALSASAGLKVVF